MSKEKKLTGYPSIDKPWLKYYKQEYIDAPLPHMTAYEYVKMLNQDRLESIAIDYMGQAITYRELFTAIDATAKALWNLEIRKGKNVLSMFPVLPHESFLFYGIDKVGAALCQIPPQYTAEEVCSSAKRIDAELFFVLDNILTEEMEQLIYANTAVRHIIAVNFTPLQNRDVRTLSWEQFMAQGVEIILPDIHRDPGDLLFLASTGGSTGEPKCVMLSDNCFNIAVHQFINSDLAYEANDRWMRLWPIFSATVAVANHHLPLCTGMRMILRQFPLDIKDFANMVATDIPNHLILIPQLLDVLESSEKLQDMNLSFIKTAGCGGLGITNQFEQKVNQFFEKHRIHTYLGYGWGCTESSAVAAHRMNHITTVIGTVGVPLIKTIVSVFDPKDGQELQYGKEGELCICSPNLMMGYYNDLKMSAKVLRRHTDGKMWLHTGDLGTINEDGIVTVRGRMTRVVFVFPTAKVYPQELESAVSKVDSVREVVFCEVPDQEHEGFFQPVCFLVPNNQEEKMKVTKNVEMFCQKNFPDYACPKHIFIKSEMPLTKVGKPDILTLEKEASEYTANTIQ